MAAGASHEITAEASAAEAVTSVGAEGGPAGVTATDGADGCELLLALVAVTVKVYEVPLVRPSTVHVRAPDVWQVCASGLDVTT